MRTRYIQIVSLEYMSPLRGFGISGLTILYISHHFVVGSAMTERGLCAITNPVRDVMFVERIFSITINSVGVICKILSEYFV